MLPMGGAWLCLHLWDRYDYNRDARYLESVYPILKGACEFFLDELYGGRDVEEDREVGRRRA
jgi:alpha-L-fucosidase 2